MRSDATTISITPRVADELAPATPPSERDYQPLPHAGPFTPTASLVGGFMTGVLMVTLFIFDPLICCRGYCDRLGLFLQCIIKYWVRYFERITGKRV